MNTLFIVLAQRARREAETPLIVLFRFLRPALTTWRRNWSHRNFII